MCLEDSEEQPSITARDFLISKYEIFLFLGRKLDLVFHLTNVNATGFVLLLVEAQNRWHLNSHFKTGSDGPRLRLPKEVVVSKHCYA